ncbi:MAG: lysylphosphatidylglycerol synthase transmembrane domain-containing protein [Amphiplicatus sp.]
MLRSLVALGGIALAILLIWLSFRRVDFASVFAAFDELNIGALIFGAVIYALSVVMRGLRWRLLLERAGATSHRSAVESMLVGFATNFALPGRLGEVYRADYLKGVTQISRTTVLGTIVVERALDGLILAAMLALATAATGAGGGAGLPPTLLATACLLFGGAGVAALLLRRAARIPLPLIGALFERFKVGLNAIDRRNALSFLVYGAGVWTLELAALASLLSAFGLHPNLIAVMLVLSASSLSTLLPTAPAFVGSYQFAYVLAFTALDWPKPLALAASIAVQLAFFLPVMLIGFGLGLRAYGLAFFRGGPRAKWARNAASANG